MVPPGAILGCAGKFQKGPDANESPKCRPSKRKKGSAPRSIMGLYPEIHLTPFGRRLRLCFRLYWLQVGINFYYDNQNRHAVKDLMKRKDGRTTRGKRRQGGKREDPGKGRDDNRRSLEGTAEEKRHRPVGLLIPWKAAEDLLFAPFSLPRQIWPLDR
jgi:hypothetical protein